MRIAPHFALVVGLAACLPALAETTPPGMLTGPAAIVGGYSGPLIQTSTEDKRTLSVVFQGIQVEETHGDGKRSDATHLALQIPLTTSSPTRLRAELRGSITGTAGVECRMSLEGPDGRSVFMAREAPQAYLKTLLPVAAGDKELTLLIALRCTGKPGSRPTFLATIDSLDLTEVPKPKR